MFSHPDLIAEPWEQVEPHLGYRPEKPWYTVPNAGWAKHRLWGSQAPVLSRRLIRASLDRWDSLSEGMDIRVPAVCKALDLPMIYDAPCWVEHAPVKAGFGTPSPSPSTTTPT